MNQALQITYHIRSDKSIVFFSIGQWTPQLDNNNLSELTERSQLQPWLDLTRWRSVGVCWFLLWWDKSHRIFRHGLQHSAAHERCDVLVSLWPPLKGCPARRALTKAVLRSCWGRKARAGSDGALEELRVGSGCRIICNQAVLLRFDWQSRFRYEWLLESQCVKSTCKY